MTVSRREIERRVDELSAAWSGKAFAEEIRRYAEQLDPDGRKELERVLLERARASDDSIERRWEERSWIRRVLRRVEEAERRARSGP
jgi:hypothetical protein